jgi:hypothetical protein
VALGIVSLIPVGGCYNGKTTSGIAGQVPENSEPPPRTPQPLDLSFIPAQAVFALSLNPQQVLHAPNFNYLGASALPGLIGRDTGFESRQIERVTFIGGPGKQLTDFFLGTIVRFKEPVDREEFIYKLSPKWDAVDDGDAHYQRAAEDGRCVFFKDSRTLVLAAEETMKKMLSVKADAESPLLTTLKKYDDAAAALGVLEVKAIRGQIMAFLLFSKPPAPLDKPPFNALVELPKNIDEVVLKFDVDPDPSLVATLRAKDEEAAKISNDIIAKVVDKFVEQIEEGIPDDPDPNAGMAANFVGTAMQELATTFKVRMQRKQHGDQIELSLAKKGIIVPATLLAPSLVKSLATSWSAADDARSRDNLAKIGAALDQAVAASGSYPPQAIAGPDGKPFLSWRVQLLPLLGEQSLYDEFHLDEPWDSAHNKRLIRRMPTVYRVPDHAFDGKTHYVLATGTGTLYAGAGAPKPDAITDDKADTIVVVTVHEGKGIEWTRPEDYKLDRADPTVGLTFIGKEDFLALFADGIVRSVDTKHKSAADILKKFNPAAAERASD